ncbi:DUF1428 domain-containing protein [Roseibium denhamense]|uniref:Uncharacterized conserved protein YbaA, DUF1428 family n=1 Tax=Roseibium denhamense TaxID=76305 RepID=A0ABY1PJX7_9HYPH|nr:DUF1428 domain-containing protein [Roseibium denhamense]MTI05931.1 DUF1428 domain-containing protein [Roseibium denhamense]SMP35842.1 Uncharacterized conserved protein YbaA, DUF1428 family [Roseibium denhamense]
MAYVQGFLTPVKTSKKAEYAEIAEKSWALFKEYGALSTCEAWGVDVPDGEVTSFPMAVKAETGETVVLSWIIWPDKETADACMGKMPEDPRWEEVMPNAGEVFSLKRMMFGGFEPIFEHAG